ncbi:hypothetical protein EUTSA_v10015387mg [Eutrema salsugineum]|uniref:F-box associated beta-propeller type 1 domain-containing protein n=1 Tax=Eutrema salsugineum TaxID=72664 RepID=V4NCA8_EUTSA|nr:hypothetical protein EUTSA_v10015387mg [Eutrema salsugineum]
MLKEYGVFPVSVNLDVAPPSIAFKGALHLKDSHRNGEVDIAKVFHCDGLLLCTTKDYRLVVWNPFALRYQKDNKTCCSYKFLRCWGREPNYRCEIYELSSDSVISGLYQLLEKNNSVLNQFVGSNKMEIWVTTKVDTKALSWSKSFTLDLLNIHGNSIPLYTFGKNDAYYIKTLSVQSSWLDNPFVFSIYKKWFPFIFSYVPSLVKIQQDRGKRKDL